MKIKQKDFTEQLRERIVNYEKNLDDLAKFLNRKYKPRFAERRLDFGIEMMRRGTDPFNPNYVSEIAYGIARKDDLLDLHRIVIWECERSFLGLPLPWNVPGSAVTGELADESYESIVRELEAHIQAHLAHAAS